MLPEVVAVPDVAVPDEVLDEPDGLDVEDLLLSELSLLEPEVEVETTAVVDDVVLMILVLFETEAVFCLG